MLSSIHPPPCPPGSQGVKGRIHNRSCLRRGGGNAPPRHPPPNTPGKGEREALAAQTVPAGEGCTEQGHPAHPAWATSPPRASGEESIPEPWGNSIPRGAKIQPGHCRASSPRSPGTSSSAGGRSRGQGCSWPSRGLWGGHRTRRLGVLTCCQSHVPVPACRRGEISLQAALAKHTKLPLWRGGCWLFLSPELISSTSSWAGGGWEWESPGRAQGGLPPDYHSQRRAGRAPARIHIIALRPHCVGQAWPGPLRLGLH